MRRKKFIMIAAAVTVAVGLSVIIYSNLGTETSAVYTSQDVVNNEIENGDIDISIKETVGDERWNGKWIEKDVKVKNHSTINSVIRISFIPRWIDENDNPWPGDTSCVKYDFGNLDKNNNTTVPLDTELWVPEISDTCREQYFYYNKIIKNEDITVDLLRNISVVKESDWNALSDEEKKYTGYIPAALYDKYKGKTLVIEVKAESVQADMNVIKAAWGETTGNKYIDEMLNKLCSTKET